jgi:hypothetical protein
VGKRDFKEEEEKKDMAVDPTACSCYNEERIVVVCRSSVKSIVVGGFRVVGRAKNSIHRASLACVHAHLHVARETGRQKCRVPSCASTSLLACAEEKEEETVQAWWSAKCEYDTLMVRITNGTSLLYYERS